MARSPRHSTLTTAAEVTGIAGLELHSELCDCGACIPASLSFTLAGSDVHSPVRITLDAIGPERRKSRAVAGERRRSSVGLVVSSDALLALFRSGRFPYQRRRPGLVAVDDA